MSDLIDRQDAIDAADRADYTGLTVEDVKKVTDEVVKELKQLPSAEQEIIYCKDCKKHNMAKGHYYNGKYIGVKECCPLVLVRGLAQGHEFDDQYCAWAERKEDE